MNYPISRALLLILALPGSPLLLKAEESSKVDHMLDELEKRLERKEAGFLSSAEQEVFDDRAKELTLDFDASTIKASLPGMDELQKISERLVGVKNDIDAISGKVMKMNYDLMHSEAAYKHARVSLNIDGKSPGQIDSLHVRMDGVEVYALDKRDAFLFQSKNIPVYIGPLTKGKHMIEFDLTLREEETGLKAVVTQEEKIMNQTLHFEVSDGENIIDFQVKKEDSGKLALQQALSTKN